MNLMHQTMRWYGPNDVVSLRDIRQSGCAGVVTALHHIPVGETWTIEEINNRKQMIEEAGMDWTVIESLPVHDDIKTKSGAYLQYIETYKQSLRNVAACGIKVITYNFMPVLDWLRTSVSYTMPDGSKALYFERAAFIVFDIYLLKRPGAAKDYSTAELEIARIKFESLDEQGKKDIFSNCLLGLPGSTEAFTAEQVLDSLKSYHGIDATKLKEHLIYFLKQSFP